MTDEKTKPSIRSPFADFSPSTSDDIGDDGCPGVDGPNHSDKNFYGAGSDASAMLRRYGRQTNDYGMKTINTMLGFTYNPSHHAWIAELFTTFKPQGLMIWDVPKGALIQECMIGNQGQILANWSAIPAEFFTMARSYEQLKNLIEKEGYEPPGWATFDTASVGIRIRIKVTDKGGQPITPESGMNLCMWGKSVVVDF